MVGIGLAVLTSQIGSMEVMRMARFGGIHAIQLSPAMDPQEFETFMLNDAFPTAAEVPGSFSRNGQSAIQSQHLLKLEEASRTYLWLVKASDVFDMPLFARVFRNMYGAVHEKMRTFGSRISSVTFAVAGSYSVGPRLLSGEPAGEPQRGVEV